MKGEIVAVPGGVKKIGAFWLRRFALSLLGQRGPAIAVPAAHPDDHAHWKL